jgi:hypothetical protein
MWLGFYRTLQHFIKSDEKVFHFNSKFIVSGSLPGLYASRPYPVEPFILFASNPVHFTRAIQVMSEFFYRRKMDAT